MIYIMGNRADEYFIFDHLIQSVKRKDRGLMPFNERTFTILHRLKEEFLSEENKQPLKAYQFTALCRLFGSETLSVLLHRYLKTEELSKFIKLIARFIPKVGHKEDSKEKMDFRLLNQKSAMISDILKALNNLTKKYSSQIGADELKKIQLYQDELVRRTAELVHKGYIPIADLFSIYEQSARMSQNTGFIPQTFKQKNAFIQIIDSAVKCYLKETHPKMNLIMDPEVERGYRSAIYSTANDQFIAQQATPILKYIENLQNKEQKVALFKEIIHFIGKNNVRTMRSEGIQDLFEIMQKYDLRNKDVLLNLLPNIPTLVDENMQLIVSKGEEEIERKLDEFDDYDFSLIAKSTVTEEERRIRHLAIQSYLMLHQNFQEDFRKVEHNLNGLSKLIAPIFNELTDQQILDVLGMLGNDRVENYNPDFIVKLVAYSNNLDYEKLLTDDKEFLSTFAERWPKFLKNNTLVLNMLNLKKNTRIQDKKSLVDILSHKLIIDPKLMEAYFNGLFLMKNKEQLSEYINNFINKAAYLGYTNFDIKKLLVAFRVLNPDIKEIDKNIVLNLLVLLSSSNLYYKDLDAKSVEYIEQCLDIVEERFSGKRVAHVDMADKTQAKPKLIDINYYEKLPTSEKIYSKYLRADRSWLLAYKFLGNSLNRNKVSLAEEFQESASEQSSEEDMEPAMELLGEDEGASEYKVEAADIDPTATFKFTDERYAQKTHTDAQTSKKEDNKEGEGFVMVEDTKPKAKASLFKTADTKKIYDRKYREELAPEDIKVAMFRRRKIQELGKLARHLFLFSNVAVNDYYEIHSNPYTKAWGVLFNFRNKSVDSPLYDEVDNILARNFSGKRLSHKLFNDFYSTVLNVALERNYHVTYTPKCQNTSWIVDVSVSKGRHSPHSLGFVFLLQEDLAFNIQNNEYQPLGMQKLMLKQLSNLSSMRIVPVFETDYHQELDKFDYLDRLISKQFMKIQSNQ